MSKYWVVFDEKEEMLMSFANGYCAFISQLAAFEALMRADIPNKERFTIVAVAFHRAD